MVDCVSFKDFFSEEYQGCNDDQLNLNCLENYQNDSHKYFNKNLIVKNSQSFQKIQNQIENNETQIKEESFKNIYINEEDTQNPIPLNDEILQQNIERENRIEQNQIEIQMLEEQIWQQEQENIYNRKRGLSKKYINKILKMKVGKTKKECSICSCDLNQNEIIRKTPCKHVFHSMCIDKWFKISQSCPICRLNFQNYFAEQINEKKGIKNPFFLNEQFIEQIT